MNNSEPRNRNTRAKLKAGPKARTRLRSEASASAQKLRRDKPARTSRALAAINSGPRQPAVLVPGSADFPVFPVCCIARFRTRKWREHSSVAGQGIRSRFGNRRYSRFGNLRYRRDEAGGFGSLALAVRAGEKAPVPFEYECPPVPESQKLSFRLFMYESLADYLRGDRRSLLEGW